ncbi:response regulator transcription factor [Trujillonella humicola]|uniref:response regulator transcription factor n=1 Tax=Trujillonella humicola TaxID=3383699 RepID=UPI003906A682
MPDPHSADSDGVRHDGRPHLSARELDALRLLAEGRSTAQVAAAMSISRNTARARIHHLRTKLDVSSRQQVVPRARDLGLLGLDGAGAGRRRRPAGAPSPGHTPASPGNGSGSS